MTLPNRLSIPFLEKWELLFEKSREAGSILKSRRDFRNLIEIDRLPQNLLDGRQRRGDKIRVGLL
jgi:hypothetical protein